MYWKRIVVVLGIVGFFIFCTIAIFSVNWGGSDKPKPSTTTSKPKSIIDYADTDTKVKMLIRGKVNNDQEHTGLSITVGRDSAVAEMIQGYQSNVVRTISTNSNTNAYKTFLSALYNSGFTATQPAPKGLSYDGACPGGKLYTFEYIDGGEDAPGSTWITSCGTKKGTFAGSLALVQSLFIDQLPKDEYDTFTRKTSF